MEKNCISLAAAVTALLWFGGDVVAVVFMFPFVLSTAKRLAS
jgi:hypothetical protein